MIQKPKSKQLLQAIYKHKFKVLTDWINCQLKVIYSKWKKKSHQLLWKQDGVPDTSQNQHHTWFHYTTWFVSNTNTNILLVSNNLLVVKFLKTKAIKWAMIIAVMTAI